MTARYHLLSVALAILSIPASAQDSSTRSPSYHDVQAVISRLLSYPGYSGVDEKILNRSGDLVAVVLTKSLSAKDIDSPARVAQILLTLRMAFGEPQLIVAPENRNPAVSMLLLEHLQDLEGQRDSTDIDNTRFAIRHNSGMGRAMEFVTLKGAPPIDPEHSQWVNSVLRRTIEIKPGMTRRDLLKVFIPEGGLYTRAQQTFALQGCDGIHVDVTFAFPHDEHGRFTETPDDKIVTISKPYLDYFHYD